MRILYASTNLPVPANNGQAIRSLSILEALASVGHELTFVSFVGKDRPETLHPISSFCRGVDLLERTLPNLSLQRDYFGRIGCLASGRAYSLERFRSEFMRKKIRHYLGTGSFDLILADSLYSLVNVPETDIPIVLNCHNVEHVILERYSQLEKNLLKKAYARVEARLLQGAERRGCQRAALAMTCSIHDRNVLCRLLPNLPIVVVPNAVNTDSYHPRTTIDSNDGDVLLFQGGMDWYPNRDAVEFFARAVLPLIRAQCPEVRFVVAGRNPPVSFMRKFSRQDGVEFTGSIPDMRPYLSAAAVVVVPLRLGSGTRIKILEACAAGRPVVSTSIGAEGLELEDGREIAVADDPADFARTVVGLLGDPMRREAMARSARSVIEKRYSHIALREKLEKLSIFGKRSLLLGSIQSA